MTDLYGGMGLHVTERPEKNIWISLYVGRLLKHNLVPASPAKDSTVEIYLQHRAGIGFVLLKMRVY